jgi:fumarate hydratase subunit beta
MDAWTPRLLSLGLKVMIGKGKRSPEVIAAIKKHGAVYFCAIGGAGALLARRIIACDCAAFPELGAEAVYRLQVDKFPVITAVDSVSEFIIE